MAQITVRVCPVSFQIIIEHDITVFAAQNDRYYIIIVKYLDKSIAISKKEHIFAISF